MNLSNTIIPRSDQTNADDLLTGPRTIRITSVERGPADQPISIRYEGDNGRPYKPGLSMRRVLVAIWGAEGAAYAGRRLTLYCDKAVTFGPDTTGGIRISHASDITEAVEIALTVKRGKRKPFIVQPMAKEQDAPDIQALADVGEMKAREGAESLRVWWTSLPAGPAKTALKEKLDGWKKTAEGVAP